MPKQDVAVELFVDGAWVNLVTKDDVLAEETITIVRGDGSESASIRSSSINLRLANDDDQYRVSNPLSPLYGKAGVNTPLRVSVAGVVRGIGEVTSWSCDQTRDFRRYPRRGKAWTDIEANGIFWRMSQWTAPLQSTMTKGINSFGTALSGAWSLEDDTDSSVLSQEVTGGKLGTYTGAITLADDERPAGASQTVKLGAGAILVSQFIRSVNSGWQIVFAFKLPAIPASATSEVIFSWQDHTGRRWTWEVNNTNYTWNIYDNTGTLLSALSTSFSGTEPNQWTRCRMKVSVSGGTVTYEPAWYVEGSPSSVGVSNTFASTTTGLLRNWEIRTLTYNLGAWYCGIFGLNNATSNAFNAGVREDFNGHVGELAADRFERLLNDVPIAWATNGDNSLSTPMGAQTNASLLDQLKEIRDTEDGVLFESKSTITPVLSLRNFRWNQTAAIIDITDFNNGLPTLPKEVTDDLNTHNIITVSNANGGSFTVEDSTSIMGTQAPPLGKGDYRQNIDGNYEDPELQLEEWAEWWLNRGTVNLPRYPVVKIELTNLSASKIAELENITIGTVLELRSYREYTIRLYVIGYTEMIDTHRRFLTFNCLPDQQFVVGVYDATSSRYDVRTCTLNGAHGINVTTLNFTITADEAWSSTSGYELMISGEKVYIPVGGMAARTGTLGAYSQVATGVVRGANGLTKVLPAGSEVHVATPGRYAL